MEQPHWTVGTDFEDRYSEAEAKAVVEARGYGSVIHWVSEYDGRSYQWRSTSMQTYTRKDGWSGVNIHC
jgi:hypothetical protein